MNTSLLKNNTLVCLNYTYLLICMLIKYISNTAHRALSDVEALERLFTDTPLQELLPRLPSRTASSQLHIWTRQKNQHGRCSFLLRALGKKITSAQAKRLDDLGLTYDELRFLRKSSDSTDDFVTTLSSKGVNSKALREKLASFVKP